MWYFAQRESKAGTERYTRTLQLPVVKFIFDLRLETRSLAYFGFRGLTVFYNSEYNPEGTFSLSLVSVCMCGRAKGSYEPICVRNTGVLRLLSRYGSVLQI